MNEELVEKLHIASQERGDVETVRQLLASGVSPDARRMSERVADDSITPLYYAAEWGHTEIARLLLQHGANVDARCKAGRTPLYMAILRGNVEIARLLIEARADVNRRALDDYTPLGRAKSKRNQECIDLLLQHGATE